MGNAQDYQYRPRFQVSRQKGNRIVEVFIIKKGAIFSEQPSAE